MQQTNVVDGTVVAADPPSCLARLPSSHNRRSEATFVTNDCLAHPTVPNPQLGVCTNLCQYVRRNASRRSRLGNHHPRPQLN